MPHSIRKLRPFCEVYVEPSLAGQATTDGAMTGLVMVDIVDVMKPDEDATLDVVEPDEDPTLDMVELKDVDDCPDEVGPEDVVVVETAGAFLTMAMKLLPPGVMEPTGDLR